jgi:hypothetical protein
MVERSLKIVKLYTCRIVKLLKCLKKMFEKKLYEKINSTCAGRIV